MHYVASLIFLLKQQWTATGGLDQKRGQEGGGVGHLEDKEVSIVWDLVGRRVVLACVSPSPEYEGFSIYVSCRQIALLSSKDLPVGDIDTLICGLTLACLNIEILKHALDFSYKT